jgi:hypothetical protein
MIGPSARRHDVLRFASDSIGTRGDGLPERRRASRVLEQALVRPMGIRGLGRRWWCSPAPDLDGRPNAIGQYSLRSLASITDATHADFLTLVDELIEFDSDAACDRSIAPRLRQSMPIVRVRILLRSGEPRLPHLCALVEDLPPAPRRRGRTDRRTAAGPRAARAAPSASGPPTRGKLR